MSSASPPSCTGSSRSRLFLVSHNFPPTSGPESSLVKLNTLDLLRRGWRVSVLTTTMEHMHQGLDRGMLEGLPADLEVLRVPSYDAVLRKRWPRLARVMLAVLHEWVMPEIYLLWLASSVPAGKHWLKRNRPAIIYSRATKHVSNVTGWFLKRSTGLPWVAHISDPWLGEPMNRFQIWLGWQLESRVFREADAIVTVSKKLAERLLRQYSWARDKVHIIPHGYAPLEKTPMPVTGAGTRALHAIHAGSFIPGLRDPDKLFSGLAILNAKRSLNGRLKLTFVGEDTARYQAQADALGLTKVVELLPSVPFHVCRDMIDQSDLLLVLDTPGFGGIFLPTKLIEYLPYAKPVLGLTEPESAVHQVLRECDLAYANQGKPDEIAAAFERLLGQWEAGVWQVSSKSREGALNYQIDRVNEQLDALLASLSPVAA